MNQVLLNQQSVNKKKNIKKTVKNSKKKYLKGKSISKTKIGKVVELAAAIPKSIKAEMLTIEPDFDMLIELLESSGLTGMSGNGYRVKTKLEALMAGKKAKTFIVNGAECEPGLIHDEWLIKNHWEEISEGIRLISRMIPFERCILACKLLKADKKKQPEGNGFEVVGVPANFPMGEERMLVRQVLGITLEKDEYPTDAGILVMNVQTVYQIYCLLAGKYMDGRYITIADLISGEAKAEYVKRGDNIKEKLRMSFPENVSGQYYAGSGVMSAHTLAEDECFSDEISFAAVGTAADISEAAKCKGCGKCNKVCPADVDVKTAVKRKEDDSWADVSDLGVEKCIQCGSCTYFCKAGKNLAGYVNG